MYCKAHPDEKGIETPLQSMNSRHPSDPYCKAHPDEKGIETFLSISRRPRAYLLQSSSRRKGNWNTWVRSLLLASVAIAKLIPTKRELKQSSDLRECYTNTIAKLIPTKRELKQMLYSHFHLCRNSIAKLIPTKRELKLHAHTYNILALIILQSSSRRKGNWNYTP